MKPIYVFGAGEDYASVQHEDGWYVVRLETQGRMERMRCDTEDAALDVFEKFKARLGVDEHSIRIEVPFDGFYQTLHSDTFYRFIEYEADWLLERDPDLEPGEAGDIIYDAVNWKKAHKNYVDKYVAEFFSTIETEYDLEIPYQNVELKSPREYNFTTDRIFVEVPESTWIAINERVNEDALRDLVREELMPRSGFHPYYSNNVDDWPEDVTQWELPQTELPMRILMEQIDDNWQEALHYRITECLHDIMGEAVNWEAIPDEDDINCSDL